MGSLQSRAFVYMHIEILISVRLRVRSSTIGDIVTLHQKSEKITEVMGKVIICAMFKLLLAPIGEY